MIYTVTFNPALDYVISVDHFTPGKINRTVSENMICGGKGINVSALLANLGYESTALGFVAGFTGAEIEKRAKELGFASDFIHVKKGMSRINVKMKSDEETEINGMGPDIQQEDVDALFEKLDGLKEGDVLVLSGSIPSMISHHIYEEIMKRLEDRVLTFFSAHKLFPPGHSFAACFPFVPRLMFLQDCATACIKYNKFALLFQVYFLYFPGFLFFAQFILPCFVQFSSCFINSRGVSSFLQYFMQFLH